MEPEVARREAKIASPGRALVGTRVAHLDSVLRLAIVLMLVASSGSGCASDYEGEYYEPVVNGRDVVLSDVLPDGYRIIGEVFAEAEDEMDGSRLIAQIRCDATTKFTRRNKRAAAEAGGEMIVDHVCEHEEFEDDSFAHDDPDTDRVETYLWCWTSCSGLVARSWAADET